MGGQPLQAGALGRGRGDQRDDGQRHVVLPARDIAVVGDVAGGRVHRHRVQRVAQQRRQAGQHVVQAGEAVGGDQHALAVQPCATQRADELREGLGHVLGRVDRVGWRAQQARIQVQHLAARRQAVVPALQAGPAPAGREAFQRRAHGGLLAGEHADRVVQQPAGLVVFLGCRAHGDPWMSRARRAVRRCGAGRRPGRSGCSCPASRRWRRRWSG